MDGALSYWSVAGGAAGWLLHGYPMAVNGQLVD